MKITKALLWLAFAIGACGSPSIQSTLLDAEPAPLPDTSSADAYQVPCTPGGFFCKGPQIRVCDDDDQYRSILIHDCSMHNTDLLSYRCDDQCAMPTCRANKDLINGEMQLGSDIIFKYRYDAACKSAVYAFFNVSGNGFAHSAYAVGGDELPLVTVGAELSMITGTPHALNTNERKVAVVVMVSGDRCYNLPNVEHPGSATLTYLGPPITSSIIGLAINIDGPLFCINAGEWTNFKYRVVGFI